MDEMEAGELLARIQVHDNRKVDDLVIEEWFLELNAVEYADALEAVRAHRRIPDAPYLTVGHVLAGVRRIRRERTVGIDEYRSAFPGDPDDARAEVEWWRAQIRRVADGEPPAEVFAMPALESRQMPSLEGAFRKPPRR